MLLGKLVSHDSTAQIILELKPCVTVCVASASPWRTFWNYSSVCYVRIDWIARRLDGAQAIIDGRVLDHIDPLFQSPRSIVRQRICELMGTLAEHEPIVPVIMMLKPWVQLMHLLRTC